MFIRASGESETWTMSSITQVYPKSDADWITFVPFMGMACPFADKGYFSRGKTKNVWLFLISLSVSQLIMDHLAPVSKRNWVLMPSFKVVSATAYSSCSKNMCWPRIPALDVWGVQFGSSHSWFGRLICLKDSMTAICHTTSWLCQVWFQIEQFQRNC